MTNKDNFLGNLTNADRDRYKKMIAVIDDVSKWFHNNRRVEKMAALYGDIIHEDSVIAELYCYYPPVKESDIKSDHTNFSQRQHMVALPFVKILNCSSKNTKGIKKGMVFSISDSYVGFLQDKRWEEASKLAKSRAIGSDSGKPTIIDMPKFKEIQAFQSFDGQSFSIDKLAKEYADITTYLFSTAYLYLPVKKDAMIDYLKKEYGLK